MISAKVEVLAGVLQQPSPEKSRKRVRNPKMLVKNNPKHRRNLGLEYMVCKSTHVRTLSLKTCSQGNCRFKCKDSYLERRNLLFRNIGV